MKVIRCGTKEKKRKSKLFLPKSEIYKKKKLEQNGVQMRSRRRALESAEGDKEGNWCERLKGGGEEEE